MQPRTEAKFDAATFNALKRTVKTISLSSRERRTNPAFALDMPEDIGIKLNNGCNLRCKHCFEWNSDGFHWDMERDERNREIDFDIVEQIFAQTRERKSKMYLWGGEPLYYSKFNLLADLLEQDPRLTTICTNAIQVEEKLDSILKIADLVLLVSLDGFERENDAIRGKGTYQKVTKAIELLLDLQRKGIYKGKVSVSLTINDSMADKLYDFMDHFERVGVDSVYFVFPWYIPQQLAHDMDAYVIENFSHLDVMASPHKKSWHSFTYHLNPERIDALLEQMHKINGRVWKNRIRFQPALEPEEVKDFVMGSSGPGMKRTQCLSISTRMDIMPDGKVNPCKFYPEFTLGDVTTSDLRQIWQGDNYEKHRKNLACGLMPACSRCVLLYNYGR